jgi:hypothetical protein
LDWETVDEIADLFGLNRLLHQASRTPFAAQESSTNALDKKIMGLLETSGIYPFAVLRFR